MQSRRRRHPHRIILFFLELTLVKETMFSLQQNGDI